MLRPLHRGSVLSAALAGFMLASSGFAEAAPKNSPFLPPANAAPTAKAAPTDYALVGMTVAGDVTLLSIYRPSDQRSTWIPVGQTVGEITVVRYDAAKDEAVIRVDGKEQALVMRQAQILPASFVGLPTSVSPLVSASPAIATPLIDDPARLKLPPLSATEEKEMEARMLVSDLLEIGQRQRAAYEEAKRQAAARAAADKANPPPAATAKN